MKQYFEWKPVSEGPPTISNYYLTNDGEAYFSVEHQEWRTRDEMAFCPVFYLCPLSLAVPESVSDEAIDSRYPLMDGYPSNNFGQQGRRLGAKEMRDRLLPLLASRDEEVKRLREALEKIANPIKHLESELQPGQKLNGVAAIQWSENGSNLSKIAQEALETKQKGAYDV